MEESAGKLFSGKLYAPEKAVCMPYLRCYEGDKHRFSTSFSTECGKPEMIFLKITTVLRLTSILPLAIIYKV